MSGAKSFIKNNKKFCVFASLAAAVIFIAVFAPLISPYDPLAVDYQNPLQAPSNEHIFGTDALGRDEFSRVLYGARQSMFSAFLLVGIILAAGTVLGILAGYFGGVVDTVIMRLSDVLISFPGLVFAIAIAGILGGSITNSIIAIAAVSWTKYARLSRSMVLRIKNKEYVAAARLLGSSERKIFFKYMLRLTLPFMIITATTDIGTMMLEMAAISFLGFGAQAPTPEWGLMLSDSRTVMFSAPWLMIFPGIAIFVVVVIFNLLGDSIRDLLEDKK